MAKADIAGLLALGAALFVAIGNVLQQRRAQEVTEGAVGSIQLFGKLLRDRRWWWGSLVGVAGVGLQAAALGKGSVLLVQALLVSSLLFALLISARISRRAVTRWEMVWALLLVAAMSVIVTLVNPQAGQSRASWQVWAAVIAVLGPVLLVCVVCARIWPGRLAAVLFALVAGSLWGVFSVVTKGVVDQLGNGVWSLLRAPELYAWALLALAATSWEQSAYRCGALTASMPTLTVAEPAVGAALGIVVLGETLQTGGVRLLFLVMAVLVMVVATAALARSQAAVTGPPSEADVDHRSAAQPA